MKSLMNIPIVVYRKTTQRPELQRMLKDAKGGKLDGIMVYNTTRLARNTSDLLNIVEELYEINVEFLV